MLLFLYFVSFLFCNVGKTNASSEEQLLNDLFTGYNKYRKPVKNYTKDLYVGVKLRPLMITAINERAQTFSTSLWITYYWFDENLRWNPKSYGQVLALRVGLEQLWFPAVCIRNELSEQKCLNFGEKGIAFILYNGAVLYNKPLQSTIQCKLDLSYYPLDEHICTYMIYPYSSLAHYFSFSQKEISIDLTFYETNEEWEIISTSISTEVDDRVMPLIPRGTRFNILVRRRPRYVLTNIFVPIFLLSVLNLMTFLLPIESGERMGMTLAIFLTFAVFLTLISDFMPKSSENMSYFGIYMAVQLCISGLTIILQTIMIKIYFKEYVPPKNLQDSATHNPDYWKLFAGKLEKCFVAFVTLATVGSTFYLILGLTVMRRDLIN